MSDLCDTDMKGQEVLAWDGRTKSLLADMKLLAACLESDGITTADFLYRMKLYLTCFEHAVSCRERAQLELEELCGEGKRRA